MLLNDLPEDILRNIMRIRAADDIANDIDWRLKKITNHVESVCATKNECLSLDIPDWRVAISRNSYREIELYFFGKNDTIVVTRGHVERVNVYIEERPYNRFMTFLVEYLGQIHNTVLLIEQKLTRARSAEILDTRVSFSNKVTTSRKNEFVDMCARLVNTTNTIRIHDAEKQLISHAFDTAFESRRIRKDGYSVVVVHRKFGIFIFKCDDFTFTVDIRKKTHSELPRHDLRPYLEHIAESFLKKKSRVSIHFS